MTERLILMLVVAALVVAVIFVARRRPIITPRPVEASDLPSGTYLLTSEGCSTCERARAELTRRGIHYTELAWQKNPDVFQRLGIDAVPSVLEIQSSGRGKWWRGGVPRRFGD